VTIIVFSFYLHDYKVRSVGHIPYTELVHRPADAAFYFLSLIGAPLSFWIHSAERPQAAFLIGIVLVVSFAVSAVSNIRSGQRGDAAPWIGVGIFVLGFAAINTQGRLGFGIESPARISRYVTHDPWRSSRAIAECGVPIFFVSILLCTIGGYGDGMNGAKTLLRHRALAEDLIPYFSYFDTCTDGVVDAPFFHLCPAPDFKVFNAGLKQFVELGFAQARKGVVFGNAFHGLTGELKVAPDPASPISRMQALGTVQSDSGVANRLVFLKVEGADKFIAAGRLNVSGPSKPVTSSGGKQSYQEDASSRPQKRSRLGSMTRLPTLS
jgi:hypothetical protein